MPGTKLKLYEKTLEEKWTPIASSNNILDYIGTIFEQCAFCDDASPNDCDCKVDPFLCSCTRKTPKKKDLALMQKLSLTQMRFKTMKHDNKFLRNCVWIIIEAIKRRIAQLKQEEA